MPELSRALTISRSAFLELREELRLVNDGYEFLDEKRILIAAEMLRQRESYREAHRRFDRLCRKAADALRDAAADQGLDGLQVYPSAELVDARLKTVARPYVGQVMLETKLEFGEERATYAAPRSTPEVRECRESFRRILEMSAEIAALSANLRRLTHEYRRTERRVRALENVVLPEIHSDLAAMEEHLDLIDQEEVIRVRTVRKQAI
ncbi:MAG: V-type ATP synthase subunit D [Gammaproteobacteria bacterium]|nr:V-type ATP synthase subunit D [Gammaproteobacteria bacterium]MDH4313225.1 V-type ATP synthase subunit D [Gammaproteobacteria bacterium]MDH5213569.1 V-type ATP synthase subunit D [Gammaproteobacteria bacterium]MDH5499793.1 V-type ATP synthase subunit D [Gammaproteobacteria bacterium]